MDSSPSITLFSHIHMCIHTYTYHTCAYTCLHIRITHTHVHTHVHISATDPFQAQQTPAPTCPRPPPPYLSIYLSTHTSIHLYTYPQQTLFQRSKRPGPLAHDRPRRRDHAQAQLVLRGPHEKCVLRLRLRQCLHMVMYSIHVDR